MNEANQAEAKDTAPGRSGCWRSVTQVGVGLILGALAGIVAGLVAGVGIAMIVGVL